MLEDRFDTALLLGLAYSLTAIDPDLNSDPYHFVWSSEGKALKSIVRILINLGKTYEKEFLANKFKLPLYLLKMLSTKKEDSGRCLICDKHMHSRVKRHLSDTHLLSTGLALQYCLLFSESSFYYLPGENKKVEEFPKNVGNIRSGSKLTGEKRNMLNSNLPFHRFELTPKYPLNPEMLSANCTNCKECGKILTKNTKGEHMRMHRLNQLVECPVCDARMKKRYLANHSKTCGIQFL